MIETGWSDFKCFNVKFYMSALVGIIKVTLRSARCKNKNILHGVRQTPKKTRTDTQRGFRAKVHYFYPNLIKTEMFPQILIELSNIKCLANQFTGSCVFTLKRE